MKKVNLITSLLILLMGSELLIGSFTNINGGLDFRFSKGDSRFELNSIANYSVEPLINNHCIGRFPQFSDFHSCLLSKNGDPDILIVGDSHGNQYYQSIRKAFPNKVVMNISEYMCLPFVSDSILLANPVNCVNRIDMVKGFINRTPAVEKIYLIGHWKLLLNIPPDNLVAKMDENDWKNHSSFVGNGIKFLQDISGIRANIVFFGDNPDFEFDVNMCSSMRLVKFLDKSPKCEVSLASIEYRNRVVDDAIKKILSSFPRVKYFDPKSFLCDAKSCPLIIESKPLYMDRNHLNYYGADRVIFELKP